MRKRLAREPRCCENFSPRTNYCRIIVIKKPDVDKACSGQKAVTNKFISDRSRNKVAANRSWFTEVSETKLIGNVH